MNNIKQSIEYLEKHFGSLMPVSDHLICQKTDRSTSKVQFLQRHITVKTGINIL